MIVGHCTVLTTTHDLSAESYWLARKRHPDVLVPHFSGPNKVLNTGKYVISHFLGETTPPLNKYLAAVRAGTEGHAPGDTTAPIEPDVTDTELDDGSPIDVPLHTKSYTPAGLNTALIMVFKMEKPDGNGAGSKIYTEALLLCADDTPFAKETFPGVLKDATKRIYFEWLLM